MSHPKLLIIDDDPDFAESLAEFLSLNGFAVDVRTDGEAGIEAARKTSYQVILTDIGLPHRNGVECMRSIREFDPVVQCILMTGYSADHITHAGIEAGAANMLSKPLDLKYLLSIISK